MIAFFRPRHVLILLAVLVVAGFVWIVTTHLPSGGSDAAQKARGDFIATCKLQGRVANGGGQLPMDDATEEHLDLYCSCIADRLDQVLTPIGIGAVGGGTASQDVLKKLTGVVAACQSQHLTPVPNTDATNPSAPAN